MDVASQLDLLGKVDQRIAVIYAKTGLQGAYTTVEGVVWAAKVEREAEAVNDKNKNMKQKQKWSQQQQQPVLLWINIKFAGAIYMGKKHIPPKSNTTNSLKNMA